MKHSLPNSIKVVEPCHENWNEMSPVEQGRHCASCNKIVTDFSKMSDRQLIKHLKSGARGCGRFRDDQLNRALSSPEPKSSWNWKWLAAASLSTLITLPSFATYAHRKSVKPIQISQPALPEVDSSHPEFLEFSGVIVDDSTGLGIDSAEIRVIANGQAFFTNADGSFYFKIKTVDFRENGFVSINKPGYAILDYDLEMLQIQPRIELVKTEEVVPEFIFTVTDSIPNSAIVEDTSIRIVYTVGLYAPYYGGLHSASTPRQPDFLARGLYAVLDFFGIKH